MVACLGHMSTSRGDMADGVRHGGGGALHALCVAAGSALLRSGPDLWLWDDCSPLTTEADSPDRHEPDEWRFTTALRLQGHMHRGATPARCPASRDDRAEGKWG